MILWTTIIVLALFQDNGDQVTDTGWPCFSVYLSILIALFTLNCLYCHVIIWVCCIDESLIRLWFSCWYNETWGIKYQKLTTCPACSTVWFYILVVLCL